jgi:hypothetical protein
VPFVGPEWDLWPVLPAGAVRIVGPVTPGPRCSLP